MSEYILGEACLTMLWRMGQSIDAPIEAAVM